MLSHFVQRYPTQKSCQKKTALFWVDIDQFSLNPSIPYFQFYETYNSNKNFGKYINMTQNIKWLSELKAIQTWGNNLNSLKFSENISPPIVCKLFCKKDVILLIAQNFPVFGLTKGISQAFS